MLIDIINFISPRSPHGKDLLRFGKPVFIKFIYFLLKLIYPIFPPDGKDLLPTLSSPLRDSTAEVQEGSDALLTCVGALL